MTVLVIGSEAHRDTWGEEQPEGSGISTMSVMHARSLSFYWPQKETWRVRNKSCQGTWRSERGLFKEVLGVSQDCARPSHLGPSDPIARQLAKGHPLNNSSHITSDMWHGGGWAQCPPRGVHGVEGTHTQDVSVIGWVWWMTA